jgi:hypothetical protein
VLNAIQDEIQSDASKFLQMNINPIKASMQLMMLLDTIAETNSKTALRVDAIRETLKEMTQTFLEG